MTEKAAPHPVRHDAVAHPNADHEARPAMLPWHRRGRANNVLPPKTKAQASGVRR